MNALCSIGDYWRMVENCVYTEFNADDIMDGILDDEVCHKIVRLLEYLNKFLDAKSWKSIIVLRKIQNLIGTLKGTFKKDMIRQLEDVLIKYFRFMECSRQWNKDIGHLKEGYLLYFVQLCDYLYGCDEPQLVENCGDGRWDISSIEYVELDDFVYDKHVKNSKYASSNYFANVSSVVIPKTTAVHIPIEFEDIYKWMKGDKKEKLIFDKNDKKKSLTQESSSMTKMTKKILWKFPIRESDLDFVCRAQLVTSYSKTDTYFAKGVDFNKEQLWLVKGPYVERKDIDEFIAFQTKKKAIRLPYIKSFMVKMKVDRWPERPGIGLRHKFGVDSVGYFMLSKSVIQESKLEIITHPGSKKWGATDVVNLKNFSVNVFGLNDAQMVCYLNHVGFRLKYNIGDLADRNFIVVGDVVYSVDETKTHKSICLREQLKEKKYVYVRNKYNSLRQQIHGDFLECLDDGFRD